MKKTCEWCLERPAETQAVVRTGDGSPQGEPILIDVCMKCFVEDKLIEPEYFHKVNSMGVV